jgi:hypothetical protein
MVISSTTSLFCGCHGAIPEWRGAGGIPHPQPPPTSPGCRGGAKKFWWPIFPSDTPRYRCKEGGLPPKIPPPKNLKILDFVCLPQDRGGGNRASGQPAPSGMSLIHLHCKKKKKKKKKKSRSHVWMVSFWYHRCAKKGDQYRFYLSCSCTSRERRRSRPSI